MKLSVRVSWLLILSLCLFFWIGAVYGLRLLLFPHNTTWHAYLLSALVALAIDVVFLYHLFSSELHQPRPKTSSLPRP